MDLDDEELEATRQLINRIRKYKVETPKEQKEKYDRAKKKQEDKKSHKRLFRKGEVIKNV